MALRSTRCFRVQRTNRHHLGFPGMKPLKMSQKEDSRKKSLEANPSQQFWCPFCSYCAFSRQNLMIHMGAKHQNVYETQPLKSSFKVQ
ncbi:hypothetical protein GE061_003396 [Apolygus lucorum]|uniref:C2H2-type domain-containing protein n=1 Tax=Apolygus lucorum TaxID=248454 RepID=A0A8S9X3F0_APOLU|nr:hypothetical protein GE061_003396 [Apolygus lucorum]